MSAAIRPARASDVDGLVAMEEAVFASDRLSRRSFRHLLASPAAAVAEVQVPHLVRAPLATLGAILRECSAPSGNLDSELLVWSYTGLSCGR